MYIFDLETHSFRVLLNKWHHGVIYVVAYKLNLKIWAEFLMDWNFEY